MREIRKKGKKKMGDSNRGVVIKMHLTENMVSRGWGLVVKEESLNQGFWQRFTKIHRITNIVNPLTNFVDCDCSSKINK